MKRTYLLSIRLWVLWIELPVILLLLYAWNMNAEVDGFIKLYPLIIALMALIVFIPIYFFRLVEISYEEIRSVGWFSNRDSALVNEGKTLKMKLLRGGKVKLSLVGHDGEYAGFDWLKPDDDDDGPRDITLYRGVSFGGAGDIKRVLSYFGASKDDFDAILGDGKVAFEYENVSVTAESDDEGREVSIRVNVTLSDAALIDNLED